MVNLADAIRSTHIEISWEADIDSLEKANREHDEIIQKTKKADEGFQRASESIGSTTEAVGKHNNELEEGASSYANLGTTAEDSFGIAGDSANGARASIENKTDAINDSANAVIKMGGASETANRKSETSTDSLKDSIEDKTDAIKDSVNAGSKFGDRIKGVMQKAKDGIGGAKDGFQSLGVKIKTTADKAGVALEKGLKTSLNIIKGAAIATATAILAIGTTALLVGDNFEQGVNAIRAQTGQTTYEIQEVSSAIRDLGMSQGAFSTQELVDGLASVSRRGQDAEHQIGLTEEAMRMAQGTGNAFGASIGYLDAIMVKFNADMDDAANFSNMFLTAQQMANVSASNLTKGMQRAAPITNRLGLEYDFVASSLSFAYQEGINMTNSSGGLTNMFENLTDSASDMGAALYDFGITSREAFEDPQRALSRLIRYMGDLDDYQQASMISSFGLTQYGDAMLDMFLNNVDALDDMADSFRYSMNAGTEYSHMLEASEARSGGLAEMWQRLRNVGNEFSLTLYDLVGSTIIEWLERGAEKASNFVERLRAGGDLHPVMIGIGEAVQSVFGAIGQLAGAMIPIAQEILPVMIEGFGRFTSFISENEGAAKALIVTFVILKSKTLTGLVTKLAVAGAKLMWFGGGKVLGAVAEGLTALKGGAGLKGLASTMTAAVGAKGAKTGLLGGATKLLGALGPKGWAVLGIGAGLAFGVSAFRNWRRDSEYELHGLSDTARERFEEIYETGVHHTLALSLATGEYYRNMSTAASEALQSIYRDTGDYLFATRLANNRYFSDIFDATSNLTLSTRLAVEREYGKINEAASSAIQSIYVNTGSYVVAASLLTIASFGNMSDSAVTSLGEMVANSNGMFGEIYYNTRNWLSATQAVIEQSMETRLETAQREYDETRARHDALWQSVYEETGNKQDAIAAVVEAGYVERLGELRNYIDTTVEHYETLGKEVIAANQETADGVLGVLQGLGVEVSEPLSTIAAQYGTYFKDILEETGSPLSAMEAMVRRYNESARTAAENELRGLQEAAEAAHQNAYNATDEYTRESYLAVAETFEAMATVVEERLSEIEETSYKYGESIPEGLRRGMLYNMSPMLAAAKTLATSLSDEFASNLDINSPSGVFYDYGLDIVQGLRNGIDENSDNAFGAIGRLASGLIRRFTSALSISSPSRLFQQFGEWTGEGYLKGLPKYFDAAVDVVSDYADKVADVSFNTTDGAVNIATSTTRNLSPNTPNTSASIKVGSASSITAPIKPKALRILNTLTSSSESSNVSEKVTESFNLITSFLNKPSGQFTKNQPKVEINCNPVINIQGLGTNGSIDEVKHLVREGVDAAMQDVWAKLSGFFNPVEVM